jgi:hypothetical protein
MGKHLMAAGLDDCGVLCHAASVQKRRLSVIPELERNWRVISPITGRNSMLRLVLLIVLILAILGSVPMWGYSTGWGYGPSGGLGLVLVIVLILVLMGRL